MKALMSLGVAAFLAIIVVSQSLFIVSETEQALVIQFGEVKDVFDQAGLHYKVPFVQNIVYYDKRVLDYAPPVEEVIALDNKRLLIDSFVRYRIVDPLKFRQTVRNEVALIDRLRNILSASLRNKVGLVAMEDLLSAKRGDIMDQLRTEVNERTQELGLDVLDVRMRRVDLPEANSQAIYERMKSERELEARDFRARGHEAAQRIRSKSDRERVVILAEASKTGEIMRGKGEAQAIKTYNDAFGQDIDFFSFYRSMQAYRQTFADDGTTMVLSPESDFLRYFGNPDGNKDGVTGAIDHP